MATAASGTHSHLSAIAFGFTFFTFTHSLTLYSLANSFLFLDNIPLSLYPGLLHVTLFDPPSHPRGRPPVRHLWTLDRLFTVDLDPLQHSNCSDDLPASLREGINRILLPTATALLLSSRLYVPPVTREKTHPHHSIHTVIETSLYLYQHGPRSALLYQYRPCHRPGLPLLCLVWHLGRHRSHQSLRPVDFCLGCDAKIHCLESVAARERIGSCFECWSSGCDGGFAWGEC